MALIITMSAWRSISNDTTAVKRFVINNFQRQSCSSPSLGAAPDSSLLALSSQHFHSKLKTFLFEQSFPP